MCCRQSGTFICTFIILKRRHERKTKIEMEDEGERARTGTRWSSYCNSQKSLYFCALWCTGQCTCYKPPSVDKMPRLPLDWPLRALRVVYDPAESPRETTELGCLLHPRVLFRPSFPKINLPLQRVTSTPALRQFGPSANTLRYQSTDIPACHP